MGAADRQPQRAEPATTPTMITGELLVDVDVHILDS
jgi:hypothetical protein